MGALGGTKSIIFLVRWVVLTSDTETGVDPDVSTITAPPLCFGSSSWEGSGLVSMYVGAGVVGWGW